MHGIAADGVAWSVVCLSVRVSGTPVNPAQMAEQIEMPFGGRLASAQNDVLDKGADWCRLANSRVLPMQGGDAAL